MVHSLNSLYMRCFCISVLYPLQLPPPAIRRAGYSYQNLGKSTSVMIPPACCHIVGHHCNYGSVRLDSIFASIFHYIRQVLDAFCEEIVAPKSGKVRLPNNQVCGRRRRVSGPGRRFFACDQTLNLNIEFASPAVKGSLWHPSTRAKPLRPQIVRL